jgi:hypothetical protein
MKNESQWDRIIVPYIESKYPPIEEQLSRVNNLSKVTVHASNLSFESACGLMELQRKYLDVEFIANRDFVFTATKNYYRTPEDEKLDPDEMDDKALLYSISELFLGEPRIGVVWDNHIVSLESLYEEKNVWPLS